MTETTFEIAAADPRGPEATGLIRALSEELTLLYDHGDDGSGNFKPEDVLIPRAAFVIGWAGSRAVACGAFRPLEHHIAEIKRMYVVPDCRGRGYSKKILNELERLAAQQGYTTVRLETGMRQQYAIRLYERSGYRQIANFGHYKGSGWSLCFEKDLPLTSRPSST